MTCRTCSHYQVEPDADGKVRMRRDKVSRCGATIPDLAAILPHSITKTFDWRQPKVGRFMAPDDGAGCPLHTPRARA